MPAGRPTKYRPEYCDKIVEVMAQGYSVAGFAGEIGVARSTVFEWMDAHPEFAAAYKAAVAASAKYWEDLARQAAIGGVGNAATIIFGLKNRSREDWHDIQRREVSGVDGNPIEVRTKKAEELTDDELAALAQSGE